VLLTAIEVSLAHAPARDSENPIGRFVIAFVVDLVARTLRRFARGMGRPRKAESFRKLVVAKLAEEPAIPTRELLEHAKAEGYDGQKSAFYALVASARDPAHNALRQPPLPGERSRHDVIDLTLRRVRKRVTLFVSRLEDSRLIAVRVLRERGIEPIARAMCEDFATFGGVPLLASFDSTRVGVAGSESVAPLAYLGLDLGVGIELVGDNNRALARAAPGSLRRALADLDREEDLGARVAAFVADHNSLVAPDLLMEERRRLRPIRVALDELTLRVPTMVRPGSVITFDSHRWFVRAATPGTSATVYLSPRRVRIVAGNASAIFTR
jgi:hypothetical protein